jgi:hypothetical protein
MHEALSLTPSNEKEKKEIQGVDYFWNPNKRQCLKRI